MKKVRCEECGESVPTHDIIHYGSEGEQRELCCRCVNADMARRSGLDDFEDHCFEPVKMTDCSGEVHEFHFRTRLLGDIVALDAFEIRDGHPGGYEFQMIGDPEEDLMGLLGRLIEKIRRRLSIRHLSEDDRFGLQIADRVVRGQIECDLDEPSRVPLIVVDGREITWDEFGRMLMTFEGWQFKLEIFDSGEEP